MFEINLFVSFTFFILFYYSINWKYSELQVETIDLSSILSELSQTLTEQRTSNLIHPDQEEPFKPKAKRRYPRQLFE